MSAHRAALGALACALGVPALCFAQGATVRALPSEAARVEGSTTFATSIDARSRGPLAESAGDLLDEAPGLHVRRAGDGLAPQTLTLRGAPAAHVVVAIDGVVLNDSGSDGVDVTLIPPALIERVDVYRGVVPAHLGVSGLGGAVEFVTRRPERGVRGWATAAMGSFGQRRASASASARGDGGAVLAAIGYRGSDGNYPFYDDRGSPRLPGVESLRRNAGGDAVDGIVRACTSGGACLLGLVGWRDRAVPGPGSTPADGPFMSQRRAMLRGHIPLQIASHRGEIWTALVLREDVFANVGAVPLFNTTPYVARSRSGVWEFGARGQSGPASWRVSPMLRARVEAFGGGALREGSNEALRLSALIGVDVDVRRGPLRATLGAGAEPIADRGATGEGTRAPYTARAGVAWAPLAWIELRANAVHARRAPTLTELYGDQGFTRGNAGLREETSTSGDAGAVLTLRVPRWSARVEALGYARHVDDLIAMVQVNRSRFQPFNLGTARVLGLEALARFEWNQHLRLSLAYALTDARVVDAASGLGGNRVPLVPSHDLHASAEATHRGVTLGASASYVSAAFLDESNDPSALVPARWLIGAHAAWTPSFARAVTLGLSATNLLNQRTAPRLFPDGSRGTVAIQDFLGYPLPGLAVLLSLSVAFARE